MSGKTSQRKKRQRERLTPEQLAVEAVASIERPPFVERIDHEVQGTWNLLCFFVRVDASATQHDADDLLNVLAQALDQVLDDADPPLDWSVGIWRGDELLESASST